MCGSFENEHAEHVRGIIGTCPTYKTQLFSYEFDLFRRISTRKNANEHATHMFVYYLYFVRSVCFFVKFTTEPCEKSFHFQ